QNAGKAAALENGFGQTDDELIVTIDGDTIFEPQTVANLVRRFGEPRVGAVSGNTKVHNRRSLLGLWQHLEYVMGLNLDRRTVELRHAAIDLEAPRHGAAAEPTNRHRPVRYPVRAAVPRTASADGARCRCVCTGRAVLRGRTGDPRRMDRVHAVAGRARGVCA